MSARLRLTVITGPMYSGKTTELLRRVERTRIAKIPVQIVVPALDHRHGVGVVRTHGQQELKDVSVLVAHDDDFSTGIADDVKLVAFDEAQFFSPKLPDIMMSLLRRDISVVAAGLDLDYMGRPFGPMPQLLALADEVVKVRAVCMRCGDDAVRTLRTSREDGTVLVGAMDAYEARCLPCWMLHRPLGTEDAR